MTNITIIDYGIGNLMSVGRAFEHVGATVTLTKDPKVAMKADRLVLPGVGAFAKAMTVLDTFGFNESIFSIVQQERPLLGICLGMQMLFESSEEFQLTKGLNLIPGIVKQVPSTDISGRRHKLPHINWASLIPASGSQFASTIMEGIMPGTEFYFIHSYTAYTDDQYRVADTTYGGHRLSGVVQRGTVVGSQFHPEKSGRFGLKFMSNFLTL
jgi:glutamine amidotransferase